MKKSAEYYSDIVGKTFGHLTVLAFTGHNKHGQTTYLCKCNCGHEYRTIRSKIINRVSKFCIRCVPSSTSGIGVTSKWRKGYKLICGRIWSKLIKRCQSLGRDFLISIEYAHALFDAQEGKCALSGVDLHFGQTYKEIKAGLTTASLDRIDSKVGYIEGNVQWIHKDINWMKQRLSQQKFIEYCCLVADHASDP